MVAKKYGLARADLDKFALESHRKAHAATISGAFAQEIVPIVVQTPQGSENHMQDEGIRPDTSLEAISSVELLQPEGVISAANASQICDGASAALIVNEKALKSHGLTPLARIRSMLVSAGDPIIMLEEPISATRRALKRAGINLANIDLYEVNEAFASIPLAWFSELQRTC